MKLNWTTAIAVAALSAIGIASVSDAHPHRKRHKKNWQTISECFPAVEGAATSRGILGLGSARARIAAQDDWETEATRRYGAAFGQLRYARGVQWDCKKGAVILAKCVVVAEPCRTRIRG